MFWRRALSYTMSSWREVDMRMRCCCQDGKLASSAPAAPDYPSARPVQPLREVVVHLRACAVMVWWHLFSYTLRVRYAHKSKLPASYRLTACVCMREYLRAAKQESVASESQAHDALCSGHLLMKHTLRPTRRSQSSRRCCRDTSKGNGALLAKQGGNHQER